jgi:hypothetical protein
MNKVRKNGQIHRHTRYTCPRPLILADGASVIAFRLCAEEMRGTRSVHHVCLEIKKRAMYSVAWKG